MYDFDDFISMITGVFDNSLQFNSLKGSMPFAKHINTVCNDKILNLPDDFKGRFVVEESYYTVNGKTNSSPHLFLFTPVDDGVLLSSYEIPSPYNKSTFTYQNLDSLDFNELVLSKKFVPALFSFDGECFSGGSVSEFSPGVIFTLKERFSHESLEVSESISVNGKRTFGYDIPIVYKRV